MQRRRREQALVAPIGSAVVGQRLEIPHLAQRQAEHRQQQGVGEDLVQAASVGAHLGLVFWRAERTRRPHLDGRVVAPDGGDVQVPQHLGQPLAAAQSGRHQVLGLGETGAHVGRLLLVPAEPSGAHQQDITLVQLGALRGEALSQLVGLDRVGPVVLQRTAHLGPPPADVGQHRPAHDATAGPVVHAVLVVGNAAVVTGARLVGHRRVVADVSEAVPLRRRLGVPPVQDVVVAGAARTTGHLVGERLTVEQRRIGQPHLPVQREHRTALDQTRCSNDALRRQQVQAAEDVGSVGRPHPPAGRQTGTSRQFVVARQCHHRRTVSVRSAQGGVVVGTPVIGDVGAVPVGAVPVGAVIGDTDPDGTVPDGTLAGGNVTGAIVLAGVSGGTVVDVAVESPSTPQVTLTTC